MKLREFDTESNRNSSVVSSRGNKHCCSRSQAPAPLPIPIAIFRRL